MNIHLEQLKSELKKFGLNPIEWNIQKTKNKRYKIAHIRDQNFYFLGEAKQVGFAPQWEQIQLISF